MGNNHPGSSDHLRWVLILALLSACSARITESDKRAVVAQYVQIAHAMYVDSLTEAQALDAAVRRLSETPDADALAAAREAWRRARIPYSQSEALRFGHWVVDDWEKRVNAWPVDEGLIDYVAADYAAAADNPAARANAIGADTLRVGAQLMDTRAIDIGTLSTLSEFLGVESNVARGYHAIEFLLWGQDRSEQGPGARPWTDYAADARCTSGAARSPARVCAKRGEFLRAATLLLVKDLDEMARLWGPDRGSYGSRLIAGDPDEALRRMLFALAAFAQQELAGERTQTALLTGSPEEEQDCFSDQTHWSHFHNAQGLEALYRGRYRPEHPSPDPLPQGEGERLATGEDLRGPSLSDLVAQLNPALGAELDGALQETRAAMQTLVDDAEQRGQSFDRLIASDNVEGAALLKRIVSALMREAAGFDSVSRALKLGAQPEAGEAESGGATTVFPRSPDVALSREALSQPAANLPLAQRSRFAVGNSLFNAAWIIAPASTADRDGLGPLYNAAACQSCHFKDGRGRAPLSAEDPALSMIVRLGPLPDLHYGHQLQDFAVPGLKPEARVRVAWESAGTLALAGGEKVELRRPQLLLDRFSGAPLASVTRPSLRLAQPLVGLGLLELIPQAQLQALADPDDRNGDGISGRINRVPDQASGERVPGRFGWKSTQPSVRQQTAHAAAFDIGLTNALFPVDDCTLAQTACRTAPSGGAPELVEPMLSEIAFYVRHLGVPARRWLKTPEVQDGKRVFHAVGCAACHTPEMRTGVSAEFPALSGQTIRPYSDLLLHDMGAGLADGLAEFEAGGSEWRTQALWGLHLAEAVAGRANYLHDGRARTLLEAVLWHGGEAQAARDRVIALPVRERENLIWFLKSL
jgi:CxxC motif-containing protein (DUF1111 family)